MRLTILFLLGATVGSFFDGFHTHSGTTIYSNPWILKMAWWTPLLFGFAAAAMGVSRLQFIGWFGECPKSISFKTATVTLTCFGLLYYATAFWQDSEIAKLILLGVGFLGLWFWLDRTKAGMLHAILTGILGCAVEMALISLGEFHYLPPITRIIPLWLFLLYMNASVSLGAVARAIDHHQK